MRANHRVGLIVLALLVAGSGIVTPPHSLADEGDQIRRHVSQMEDGRIYFSYASWPGVYGDGHSIITHDDEDDDWTWRSDCEEGPARVSLHVRDGSVRRLRVRVGGAVRGVREEDVDLGDVPPAEAAAFLLDLARTGRASVAEDAVLAATLADEVEVWPDLLEIARDRDRPQDVRESAIFWLGQAAGEAATRGLESVVGDTEEDIELREHAVFALSQRPANQCVPALSEIARTNRYPELRRSALFWLAQHDDPRVIALFEEILTQP
jgi:hypothetical protein